MQVDLSDPPPHRIILRLVIGTLAGNAVGFLLIILTKFISASLVQTLVLPSLFLVPFAMGLVMAWVWRPLDPPTSIIMAFTLLGTGLGLGLATIVFGEGMICLIIISPVIYAFIVTGALSGRSWFRASGNRLNAYLAPALALVIVTEPAFRQPRTSVVIDEITIAAPPAKIWPHLLAFKTIPDAPDYWLFKLGLPCPMETTNGGDFVGANRACIFSGGAVFKERIAEFIPEKLLTFDILESPPDPELLGHLDSHRGQFELRDNHDGTTTLIGSTWYTLHVSPAPYFDWWVHDIFSAVHLRVMRHVQRLAEAP